MNKKRGIFFSTDALVALTIIFLTVLIVFPIIKYPKNENDVQQDIVKVFSKLKVGEINNSMIINLTRDGIITDPDKTILEQIGEFYVTNLTLAKQVAIEMLSYLNSGENIGIWYGTENGNTGDLLASTNKTPYETSKNVIVEKEVITGVQRGYNLKAYSARAYLSKTVLSSYNYFGGYTGDGNISINFKYNGTIDKIILELAINNDFDIYINGLKCPGHWDSSSSVYNPRHYDFTACRNLTHPGINNFKLAGEGLYIAGGYLRVDYFSDIEYALPKRYYFPGIEGGINIYDGFFIPSRLEGMNISLHIDSNFTTLLTIGNITVYNGSTIGEQTININNDTLYQKLNFSEIVNKTIPIRLGLLNASYVIPNIGIDSILVTDVSGSMEWCSGDEASNNNLVWTDGDNTYLGTRWALTKDCYPQKINPIKEAEKAYVTSTLNNTRGPKIGIIDYSGNGTVINLSSDLITSLYIGSLSNYYEPGCYEPDWFETNYDDSSWNQVDINKNINIDSCSNCIAYFRKNFIANNISNIKYTILKIPSNDDGIVCFINGKEVFNKTSAATNQQYYISSKLINKGDNILACSVKQLNSNFLFDVELYTDQGSLIPDFSPAVKYTDDSSMQLHYSFDNDISPTTDSSENGNDGYVNSALWKFDGSYYFDGFNDYIDAGTASSLQLNNSLTIEFWINPYNLGASRQSPIYKSDRGEFALILENGVNTGNLSFYHGWGSSSYISWSAFDRETIKNKEWQHIVITRDSTTRTIKSYYNGVLKKTTNYSAGQEPRITSNSVFVGSDSNNFNGKIDEVALYNRVLNEDDILTHFNSANLDNKWRRLIRYSCRSSTDPKFVQPRGNVSTDYTLVATVKNQGRKIFNSFYLSFYNGSVTASNKIGYSTIAGLDSFEYKTVKINWTANLSSSMKIIAYADNENNIPESNENNNQGNITIVPYGFIGKDLTIQSLIITPNICTWNPRTYYINATILNRGNIDVTENFDVTFYINSINESNIINVSRINGLNLGQTKNILFIWTADISENTQIIAIVDNENIIIEDNENNNNLTSTIALLKPNLVISTTYSSIIQPVCYTGEANVNFSVVGFSYNCNSRNNSDISVSSTRNDYSYWKPIPPISGNSYTLYYNFTLLKNFPIINGALYNAYFYIDKNLSNVSESSEFDNEYNYTFYIGPNIYFYDNPSLIITPNYSVINTLTNYNLSARIRNTQCGPITFNVSFYKNSVDPLNLINWSRVTLTSIEIFKVNVTWQANLMDNTTIYAVIDSGNEITENNEANTATAVISVGTSIIPFGFYLLPKGIPIILKDYFKFDPLAYLFLGLSSTLPGNNVNLFSPDSNIVRTKNLTNNESDLYDFISNTNTWWGTCICCGINKAIQMLNDSSADNKFIVVMSDGEANIPCKTSDAKQDAIDAACDAYKNHSIRVYSVGFGPDVDAVTMSQISSSSCGNGSYYFGNISNIIQVYQQISDDIKAASYKQQTVVLTPNINTILFPDSYIDFFYNYTSPSGVIITQESKFINNSFGSFDLIPNSSTVEAKVISYSGPKWTSDVQINGVTVYNIAEYGGDYVGLGDPFAITIPNGTINDKNLVRLRTGLASSNVSEGSINDTIIHTVMKNIETYSRLSGGHQGCNWSVMFQDDSLAYVLIPANYTGLNKCSYSPGNIQFSNLDALQEAGYNLLSVLDLEFPQDQKVNVKFDEQNLQIGTTMISGIPWHYYTEVQIRKWY